MTLFSDVPDEVEEFGKGIDFWVKIAILGLGVIGTTYAYAFQKSRPSSGTRTER